MIMVHMLLSDIHISHQCINTDNNYQCFSIINKQVRVAVLTKVIVIEDIAGPIVIYKLKALWCSLYHASMGAYLPTG